MKTTGTELWAQEIAKGFRKAQELPHDAKGDVAVTDCDPMIAGLLAYCEITTFALA